MSSDTATTIVIAVLGSGGLFAIIGALINGAFTKRKLSAEATEVITNAASSVVTQIEKQRDDLRKEMTDLKTEHAAELGRLRDESAAQMQRVIATHLRELEERDKEAAEERQRWVSALQLHVAWDWMAIHKLSEIGIELPDPPPILPRDTPPEVPAKG